MSDPRRIIEIYLDTENSKQVTEENSDVRANITLYRNTRVVIRAHLRLADGTTYLKPPSGTTWFFGLDNSFDPAQDDPVYTQDADFNIGSDWSDVDPENGKVCWRINTSTTQLETAMGTDEKWVPQPYGELWMTPPGVDSILLCQWPVIVRNIVSEIDADTTLEYYSNGLFVAENNDVILFFPDGTVAQRWSKT